MKKRLVLFLVILAIAAVCVFGSARKRQQGVTIAPGEVITLSTSGEMVKDEPTYYWYKPQPDIAPYELALLLPYFHVGSGFGGLSSGKGAMVALEDRHHGGWPAGSSQVVMRFYDSDIKGLGPAMRHFVKLPLGDK